MTAQVRREIDDVNKLNATMAALKAGLVACLQEPDARLREVQKLREAHEALRDTVGARATSEALRALAGAERSVLMARKREAAELIATVCRELGVILEPKAPLKRAPRKKAAKPKPVVEVLADDPEAPRELDGFLRSGAQ